MKILEFIKYLWIKMLYSSFAICSCFLILYSIPFIIFWILSMLIGNYLAFLLFIILTGGLLIGLFFKAQWDDFNKDNEEN